jgi:GTP:adenosylcobinamide-phosphate guanylyltransferase
MTINVLLTAGRRPGIDPLAAHFGIDDKALIPVAGEAMLSRVARTLVSHPQVARVTILAQEPERLVKAIAWMNGHPKIATRAGGASLGEAIMGSLAEQPGDFPFLLTTADNALLDHAMIDTFLAGAQGYDIAVGMVEQRVMQARYPESRRTWLRFRGGAWSGANLYWFGTPRAEKLIAIWRGVEQQRKKGRAIVGAFGLPMLIAVGLRLLTIHAAVARVGRRFGLDARIVPLPFAEACIDVDKPDDHALVERIIAASSEN